MPPGAGMRRSQYVYHELQITFQELATRNKEILSKQSSKSLAREKRQVALLKKTASQSNRKTQNADQNCGHIDHSKKSLSKRWRGKVVSEVPTKPPNWLINKAFVHHGSVNGSIFTLVYCQNIIILHIIDVFPSLPIHSGIYKILLLKNSCIQNHKADPF